MNSNDEIVRCPACGGRDVRLSTPKGLLDSFLAVFRQSPFRCRSCRNRFHRYVLHHPASTDLTAPVDKPDQS